MVWEPFQFSKRTEDMTEASKVYSIKAARPQPSGCSSWDSLEARPHHFWRVQAPATPRWNADLKGVQPLR